MKAESGNIARLQKITELRQLLAQKFPQQSKSRNGDAFPTGIASIDEQTRGGLPKGAVIEITGSLGGSSLFLSALLQAAARSRSFLGLVDGSASFDPQAVARKHLRRLLWMVCRNADHAIKAADLLLHDGNLPLVVLDLQLNPPTQLRKIPASTWFRFQQAVENKAVAFVVITPQPMVSSAAMRIIFPKPWTLPSLQRRREHLLDELEIKVVERGIGFSTPDGEQLKTA